MRLLTHNTLRNNSADAQGKGHPLRITATEVRVDDASEVGSDPDREIAFVKGVLAVLDWSALVQVRKILIFRFFYRALFTFHRFCKL